MKTNKLAQTAERFFEACRKIPFTQDHQIMDLTPVMKTLTHLKFDEGYVLECRTPGNEGMGGVTTVYARRKDDPTPDDELLMDFSQGIPVKAEDDILVDMEPEGHVTVDGSPESVWEFWLFLDMWRFLPLWWHANYDEETYITDADSLLEITKITPDIIDRYNEEDSIDSTDNLPFGFTATGIGNAIALCGDEFLLPSSTKNGELCEVIYTYWTEWGGLVRERIQAMVSSGRVIFIGQPLDVKLVEYDCGIMF